MTKLSHEAGWNTVSGHLWPTFWNTCLSDDQANSGIHLFQQPICTGDLNNPGDAMEFCCHCAILLPAKLFRILPKLHGCCSEYSNVPLLDLVEIISRWGIPSLTVWHENYTELQRKLQKHPLQLICPEAPRQALFGLFFRLNMFRGLQVWKTDTMMIFWTGTTAKCMSTMTQDDTKGSSRKVNIQCFRHSTCHRNHVAPRNNLIRILPMLHKAAVKNVEREA